jgi:DNA-directed RNA polymerase specialized sigma24 family protein
MLLALTPDSVASAPATVWPRAASRERALMDAIRSGDERLAGEIHAALLPTVHATLGRVLGPSCDGHEWLIQRSIEQIITALGCHPSPWVCKLEAWAAATTARLALDVLRSRARSRSAEPKAAAPGSALERLRWLLAELPPQHAEAVVLCNLMSLAPTEVAVILGVGLEHVRRLVSAGRERLSRALC